MPQVRAQAPGRRRGGDLRAVRRRARLDRPGRAAPTGEFGQLLTRFWGTAARIVDRWDGIVDKFVGDEAVALFIPGFAGQDHAARAVATARDLLETGHGDGDPWIPVGVGIHTGLSYVGYIAEGDAVDFTAVNSVNTAARLTSIAKAARS